ncbi:hypothetical protein CMEL01_14176 [Colletotrichum melonis]|uniref:Uncharacterized protein n=1 Tax=Colletotrichum melonis TaxID=1209925 RepID=A0AAI9UPC8_9PEZI|nr:hypothetical protein CMEL01_14176 [Colletotrichum melonis]
MRPAISADRRRSTSGLFPTAAQVPANPSLAYLTLRSRAACLAQLRLVLPASLPRTNGGYKANSTTTTDFRAPTF